MNASVSLGGSIDLREFRNVLGRFASGVTIVTTESEGQVHGMTANAFMSVSLEPPLILVSVNHRANMHPLLAHSGCYGVSILSVDQQALSNHFAGRPVEGLTVSFVRKYNVPVLDGAVAHLIARVVDQHPAGDHTLYIGQVEYLDWRDGQPLLFYAGKYRQLDTERLRPSPWPEDDFSLFSISNF